MSNQTSYHAELKADVGISICPGPFPHHTSIPSPRIPEQWIMNTSKAKQGTQGSLRSAEQPHRHGGHNQKSLPPSLLHHCQFWTGSGGSRGTPGSPALALAAAVPSGAVVTHPSLRYRCPAEGTLPEPLGQHGPARLWLPARSGAGPALPVPRSSDSAAFAPSRVPITAACDTKGAAQHRAAGASAGWGH